MSSDSSKNSLAAGDALSIRAGGSSTSLRQILLPDR